MVKDEKSLEPRGSGVVVLELGNKDLLLIPAGKETSFFAMWKERLLKGIGAMLEKKEQEKWEDLDKGLFKMLTLYKVLGELEEKSLEREMKYKEWLKSQLDEEMKEKYDFFALVSVYDDDYKERLYAYMRELFKEQMRRRAEAQPRVVRLDGDGSGGEERRGYVCRFDGKPVVLGPVQMQVVKALLDLGGEAFLDEIVRAVGKEKDQVKSVLKILVKRKIVERISRGVYRVLRVITIASDRVKKEESK
jgi:hypothetical protein